jgi:hypothetical protein
VDLQHVRDLLDGEAADVPLDDLALPWMKAAGGRARVQGEKLRRGLR